MPVFFASKPLISTQSMSASLVGSSILSETLLSKFQRTTPKTMAACVDSRTESARNPLSADSVQSQIDNSHFKFVKFNVHNFPDLAYYTPSTQIHENHCSEFAVSDGNGDDVWLQMREEAKSDSKKEPILANYYYSSILSQNSLESALAAHLGSKLCNPNLACSNLADLFLGIFMEDSEIRTAIREDLRAVKERDPACISLIQSLLNFKGFLACQAHRAAHKLWNKGRRGLAIFIQNRVSEVFAVDIHPGARIGKGILFDHATGVVIGETAVIGNNVSILHNVTLGGTGKTSGDRHPKIGDGVLVGAGTNVLGNVKVGEGAKIGAGSVVLKEVPPRTTAVGNPARLVGGKQNPFKLSNIPSYTMDHISFISEWSDYVI